MYLSRASHRAFAIVAVLAAVWLWTFADASRLRARRAPARAGQAELAARLGLTDICLFTEARYTRHLSQADAFSPYQDHPGAVEHFPSGSLVVPPDSWIARHAHLAGQATVPR
jgi:hypothetical protein